MAAMAGVMTSVDLWTRFRCLTQRQVDEGNFVAGERLWEVVPSSNTLTIRSTCSGAHAIECAFDDASGRLTCTAGAGPLAFRVIPDRPGMLRCRGRNYTLAEAVNLILDELIWDEGDQA